jgi:hypothetical protein
VVLDGVDMPQLQALAEGEARRERPQRAQGDERNEQQQDNLEPD